MSTPTPTALPRLLFRVDEAAEVLGLSKSQVRNLIARRELESVTIGRSRRIRAEALQRFADTRPSDGAE